MASSASASASGSYILRLMKEYPNEYHVYQVDSKYYGVGKVVWSGRSFQFYSSLCMDVEPADRCMNWRDIDPVTLLEGPVLYKVFPRVSDRDVDDYRILFAIQAEVADCIHMKAALRHIETGDVVTLASMNNLDQMRASGKSFDPAVADGWYVYRAAPVAPAFFWDKFKLTVLGL